MLIEACSHHHCAPRDDTTVGDAPRVICLRIGRNSQPDRRMEYWNSILVWIAECAVDGERCFCDLFRAFNSSYACADDGMFRSDSKKHALTLYRITMRQHIFRKSTTYSRGSLSDQCHREEVKRAAYAGMLYFFSAHISCKLTPCSSVCDLHRCYRHRSHRLAA